jgi:ABC-type nitrate/sulfonate/bicarbonate transport system permease component
MVRALIQPEGGTPGPSGVLARRGRRTAPIQAFPLIGGVPTASAASSSRLRSGYGLLIAAGVSLGLWTGLAKLALTLLR